MQTTLQRIDIQNYKNKFQNYPDDLLEFSKNAQMKLPNIEGLRGQALALLSQPEVRNQLYLIREDTIHFFQNIGLSTDDSIQPFNKDFGIKKVSMKGKYCIEYPFIANTTHILKRTNATISGDRNEQIESIKTFWKTNLIEIDNSKWQIGHLDPTIPDSSESNLAFQPPLQARYRDRFKWDAYFHKMWPTAERELIPNFDKYYTKEEQQMIYNHLCEKFIS